MNDPTDSHLIRLTVEGDQQAFSALHRRHGRRLVSFLRGRLELGVEEAEDFVQDAFVALAANDYAALRRFEGRSSFYTYLCTIAMRRAYRASQRQPQLVDPGQDGGPDPADDPTDRGIVAGDVRQAIGQLPEDFRVALMLHHFGGMKYHEIARLLGVPQNTVATRICRAKQRLKDLLSA